ncbi:MAG TPA: RNA polymerase sigma factor, partial [Acidimicrobiales bacterium]|nr:RNA polymerase sigma factor [Acidimicrobiales bacterium]
MVLGVCRRILHDGHDVEDAFQATFLVLVRRARSIRDPGRLGPWLHGVARRVALGARSEASRRRSHQDVRRLIGFAEDPAARPASRAEGEDVLDIIDQEISRLPARYREAVVLCDLEGRSYAEAAHRLRCPLGTLQSRLARGRARLRARLVRRGLAPSLLAAILAQSARAKVPGPLADLTVRAATAGAFPASVAALAAVAGRGMILSSIKSLAVALCVVSFMLGAGLLARDRLSAEPPAGAAPEPQAPETDRTLHLQVVDDADQSALAGASVRVQFDVNETRVSEDRADDEGHATIGLPDEGFRWLEADVIHPGFVPIELIWSGEEPIPDRYVVALERGIAIGGTVHDEQGRPIAGARVHL